MQSRIPLSKKCLSFWYSRMWDPQSLQSKFCHWKLWRDTRVSVVIPIAARRLCFQFKPFTRATITFFISPRASKGCFPLFWKLQLGLIPELPELRTKAVIFLFFRPPWFQLKCQWIWGENFAVDDLLVTIIIEKQFIVNYSHLCRPSLEAKKYCPTNLKKKLLLFCVSRAFSASFHQPYQGRTSVWAYLTFSLS